MIREIRPPLSLIVVTAIEDMDLDVLMCCLNAHIMLKEEEVL